MPLEDGQQPFKARRFSKAQKQKRKFAALENELASYKAAQAKGAGKGGKGTGKKGGKNADGEAHRRNGKGEWCHRMATTGECKFGDKCWFRHT